MSAPESPITEKRSSSFSRGAIIVVASVVFALVASALIYQQLPDYRNATQEQRLKAGRCVVDSNGRLLRLFPDAKERFNVWRDINSFPGVLKEAVIAAEDKRFYYHPGFDPVALVRAFYTNIVNGRTVSGASTITQQGGQIDPAQTEDVRSKIVELFSSMKMEWQLTKTKSWNSTSTCRHGRNHPGCGLGFQDLPGERRVSDQCPRSSGTRRTSTVSVAVFSSPRQRQDAAVRGKGQDTRTNGQSGLSLPGSPRRRCG